MAWTRPTDSGRWKTTIRTGLAKPKDRLTRTFDTKREAEDWSTIEEAKLITGSFIDPRLGEVTVGDLWKEFAADRKLETASKQRDESHWNKWVKPTWANQPIGPIRKPHVSKWVVQMERPKEQGGPGAQGWTVDAALKVLRTILEIAVGLGYVGFNAARGVTHTPPEPHIDRILEEWEDQLLLSNLEARFPGQPEAALFVETLIYTGLRYQELAALDRAHLIMRERQIHVARVMQKDGSIKVGTKSRNRRTDWGLRFVPVDDDLWPRLLEQAMRAGPGSPIFTTESGGPLLYDNWRKRVWDEGLVRRVPMTDEEIEAWKAQRRAQGLSCRGKRLYVHEVPVLEDLQPTPHDMRHTYGTRLADAGVPEKDIAALMGHSPNSPIVKRYLHAREKRHDQARAAMASVRQLRRAA